MVFIGLDARTDPLKFGQKVYMLEVNLIST